MTIQTGDTITIRRGKLKGQKATVEILQGDPATAYVVKLPDGTLSLETAANVKPEAQATITEGDLAAIISTEANVGVGDFESLVHALDAKLPGFAQRVGLPQWMAGDDRDGTYAV